MFAMSNMILLALVLGALWAYLKYVYSYWALKGFPHIKPSIPFGNLYEVLKGTKSFGTAISSLYEQSSAPIVGVYLFFRPALMIRDPDLAKDMLTKNFAQFHDRGVHCDENNDPLSANLFALPGSKWKSLRTKLTPAFSSGKLKGMFPAIEAIGNNMVRYIEENLDKTDTFEMRELLTRYAIDIIQNVIFGLEANCIDDPNSEFIKTSKLLTDGAFLTQFKQASTFVCPGLLKTLHLSSLPSAVANFMIGVVRKTIEFRESHKMERKDFMQLLLQLRNSGNVGADGDWGIFTKTKDTTIKSFSVEDITARVLLFHIAGTETSALTAAFCLFEATRNPKVLKTLEEDICHALQKHNNTLTYEAIKDMPYLELCILETIRKYPGLPILNRECTETFQVPGSNHIIEKGTPIIIPSLGINRDEAYFPNPLQFDPNRFADDVRNFKESAFQPFGEGPRMCIGLRLGKINAKVAVIMLLAKFNFEALDPSEPEISPHSVSVAPKNGIHMRVTRKQKPLV